MERQMQEMRIQSEYDQTLIRQPSPNISVNQSDLMSKTLQKGSLDAPWCEGLPEISSDDKPTRIIRPRRTNPPVSDI